MTFILESLTGNADVYVNQASGGFPSSSNPATWFKEDDLYTGTHTFDLFFSPLLFE